MSSVQHHNNRCPTWEEYAHAMLSVSPVDMGVVIHNLALSAHGISYSVNFACGFFTAVLSSQDQVPTQEWLGLFTSESKADSLDSANKLLQSLIAVYNKIAIQLYEAKFEPVLWESAQITDWFRGSITRVVDWCVGYCHGVDISSFTWLEGQYP